MKKITKIALTTIPLIGTAGGIGSYMLVKMNHSNKNNISNSNNNYTSADTVTNENGITDNNLINKFQIFPQLNSQMFYKYIRIQNGAPIMNKNFIANVVNYVLKNMKISDGKIKWGYSINDQKNNLKITFKWLSGMEGRIFTKTYDFDLTKDV